MSMNYVKKQAEPGVSGCVKCDLYDVCMQLPEIYCTAVGNDFEDYYERT